MSAAGNTVLAKMEANNTSVKNTNAVFVNVYRHVNLKAHHHNKAVTTLVYQKQYPGFDPSFYGTVHTDTLTHAIRTCICTHNHILSRIR